MTGESACPTKNLALQRNRDVVQAIRFCLTAHVNMTHTSIEHLWEKINLTERWFRVLLTCSF
jgi:hypothetical protein